jgi:hypothetical protein
MTYLDGSNSEQAIRKSNIVSLMKLGLQEGRPLFPERSAGGVSLPLGLPGDSALYRSI